MLVGLLDSSLALLLAANKKPMYFKLQLKRFGVVNIVLVSIVMANRDVRRLVLGMLAYGVIKCIWSL
jgi:hypothetical protein